MTMKGSYGYNLTYFRNPIEYLRPEDTYSPVLHRINQVIGYRAVHPNEPLPPPIEVLTKYSQPPEELVKGSEKVRKKMIEAFDVKKGGHSFIYKNIDISSSTETRQKKERG